MKTFAAGLLFFASLGFGHSATAAEVYKCVVDGKVQNRRASRAKAQPQPPPPPSPMGAVPLAGCYSTPIKGMEDGFAVRNGANSPYEIVFTEKARRRRRCRSRWPRGRKCSRSPPAPASRSRRA